MRSAQALGVILTVFLAVVSQCTISTAQGVVTQTGKETIESYDSATERLTISVEYSYQWQIGPNRSFTVPTNLIGNPSFTWTGTGACTFTPQNRTIRCTSGITSFSISYRYLKQINATEDGKEEFTYQSTFERQSSPTNGTYDLFYPSSWTFSTFSPEPNDNVEERGHFQWVQQNTRSFVAQVRFQGRPLTCEIPPAASALSEELAQSTEELEGSASVDDLAPNAFRPIDILMLSEDYPDNISEAEACGMYPDLCKAAPLPGEGMEPPGRCTWPELTNLEKQKDKYCLVKHKCRDGMDCPTLLHRTSVAQGCVKERRKIMTQCYRGGDLAHYGELLKEVGVQKNCEELLEEECQC